MRTVCHPRSLSASRPKQYLTVYSSGDIADVLVLEPFEETLVRQRVKKLAWFNPAAALDNSGNIEGSSKGSLSILALPPRERNPIISSRDETLSLVRNAGEPKGVFRACLPERLALQCLWDFLSSIIDSDCSIEVRGVVATYYLTCTMKLCILLE